MESSLRDQFIGPRTRAEIYKIAGQGFGSAGWAIVLLAHLETLGYLVDTVRQTGQYTLYLLWMTHVAMAWIGGRCFVDRYAKGLRTGTFLRLLFATAAFFPWGYGTDPFVEQLDFVYYCGIGLLLTFFVANRLYNKVEDGSPVPGDLTKLPWVMSAQQKWEARRGAS